MSDAITAIERLARATSCLAAATELDGLDDLLAENAADLAGVSGAAVRRDGRTTGTWGAVPADGVAIPLEPDATLVLTGDEGGPDGFGRRAAALLGLHGCHLRHLLLARRAAPREAQQEAISEMAASILHNVGNVLNSVVVLAEDLARRAQQSRTVQLGAALDLLRTQEDPGRFLLEDARGRLLPALLVSLATALDDERRRDREDLDQIQRHLTHIRAVIGAQQGYATRALGPAAGKETTDLAQVVADALAIVMPGLERRGIAVEQRLERPLPWEGEPHRVLQIVTNLLSNAQHALSSCPAGPTIRISLGTERDRAVIAVADNGCGIDPGNRSRLFNLGFTTRPDGHGFGLHSSRINAEFLGGVLTAASDGPGRGATFTLTVPGVLIEGQR